MVICEILDLGKSLAAALCSSCKRDRAVRLRQEKKELQLSRREKMKVWISDSISLVDSSDLIFEMLQNWKKQVGTSLFIWGSKFIFDQRLHRFLMELFTLVAKGPMQDFT